MESRVELGKTQKRERIIRIIKNKFINHCIIFNNNIFLIKAIL